MVIGILQVEAGFDFMINKTCDESRCACARVLVLKEGKNKKACQVISRPQFTRVA